MGILYPWKRSMTTPDNRSPVARVRDKLSRDKAVTVVNADHPSASLVEALARQPVDIVLIDCEQGSPGVESVENMARAARLHRMASVVRVFNPQDWVIERYLFRGVDGLVAPRVDRATDAQGVVDGVRYCFPDAAESKLVVVQIESRMAVDELDDFLAVEGIDVYFIGPVDLAKSMGCRGNYRVPEVQAVMDEVIERTRAAGRNAGILVDDDNVADYVRKGVRFLYTHVNDFIAVGANAFAGRVDAVQGDGGEVSTVPSRRRR